MAVFFYGCITLDGYLATKKHELDWLYDTGSPLIVIFHLHITNFYQKIPCRKPRNHYAVFNCLPAAIHMTQIIRCKITN